MSQTNGIPENATLVFKGKIFDVYQWEQEMFDGSKKTFEKLKRNDTVDIVAVLDTGEIIILEEEQPGREPFYGLVGGTCEEGEESLDTAKRELLEETGLMSEDWTLFGSYKISSKIAFKSNIFIARNCKKVQDQNLDIGGEKIKIKQVNWSDFLDTIANKKFKVNEFALEVLRDVYTGNAQKIKEHITKGTSKE